MLMGVLVIAFPVSVFTELWSKELRRTGALLDWSDDDSEPPSSSTRLDYNTIETVLPRDDNGDNVLSDLPSDDFVVLHKDDLAEIVANLQTIGESQRQIKNILKKYHHH